MEFTKLFGGASPLLLMATAVAAALIAAVLLCRCVWAAYRFAQRMALWALFFAAAAVAVALCWRRISPLLDVLPLQKT